MVATGVNALMRTPTNIGPLTTTYTAPATCTGLDIAGRGNIAFYNKDDYYGQVGCEEAPVDCVPAATRTDVNFDRINYAYGYLTYHSPGLICPSGWTTAASYTHGESHTTSVKSQEMMMNAHYGKVWPLEGSETLVACCPEGFQPTGLACTGAPATSIDPVTSGYCVLVQDRNRAISSTIQPVNTQSAQLRVHVSQIVMVHKASDLTQQAGATPTASMGSDGKTTGPAKPTGSAKEESTEKPKKSASSSLKTSVGMVATVALAVVLAF